MDEPKPWANPYERIVEEAVPAVREAAYLEDLTIFDVSEGFAATADASTTISEALLADDSFTSQTMQSLLSIPSTGKTIGGVKVMLTNHRIDDIASARRIDGEWTD